MRIVKVECAAGQCVATCETDELMIGAFCTGGGAATTALPLGLRSPTEVVCTTPAAGYTITATCLRP